MSASSELIMPRRSFLATGALAVSVPAIPSVARAAQPNSSGGLGPTLFLPWHQEMHMRLGLGVNSDTLAACPSPFEGYPGFKGTPPQKLKPTTQSEIRTRLIRSSADVVAANGGSISIVAKGIWGGANASVGFSNEMASSSDKLVYLVTAKRFLHDLAIPTDPAVLKLRGDAVALAKNPLQFKERFGTCFAAVSHIGLSVGIWVSMTAKTDKQKRHMQAAAEGRAFGVEVGADYNSSFSNLVKEMDLDVTVTAHGVIPHEFTDSAKELLRTGHPDEFFDLLKRSFEVDTANCVELGWELVPYPDSPASLSHLRDSETHELIESWTAHQRLKSRIECALKYDAERTFLNPKVRAEARADLTRLTAYLADLKQYYQMMEGGQKAQKPDRLDLDTKVPRADSLAGIWYYNGDTTQPCAILQLGGDAYRTIDQQGGAGLATVKGEKITVAASATNEAISGDVYNDGRSIRWARPNTVWSR